MGIVNKAKLVQTASPIVSNWRQAFWTAINQWLMLLNDAKRAKKPLNHKMAQNTIKLWTVRAKTLQFETTATTCHKVYGSTPRSITITSDDIMIGSESKWDKMIKIRQEESTNYNNNGSNAHYYWIYGFYKYDVVSKLNGLESSHNFQSMPNWLNWLKSWSHELTK